MSHRSFDLLRCIATVVLVFNVARLGHAQITDVRLPTSLRPTKYDLFLRMVLDENSQGLEQYTSPGNVTIFIDCVQDTSNITLNSEYIEVVEAGVRVRDVTGTPVEIPVSGQEYDVPLKFFIVNLGSNLLAGRKYELFIPFVAPILTNDTYGLYRGYYVDQETNVTKNMATTFFQPFGARRMFPCFDEPDYKAEFQINVARTTQYQTLANMDLNATVQDLEYAGWEWDKFNPTVPMSTYIVCVIVSDFAFKSANETLHPKPVRVWGTPYAINVEKGGDYGADMAARILTWYETYTGIPYALPKIDSIAIPQFAAGAMENWGLNTYRDAALIYKEGDSDSARIGVTETLSHELSHQWFGNLATCEWWDQMWLNEGFATYFTYRALINIVPEFDTETRYIYLHQQNSLKFDSNPNRSHPVVIPTPGFDFFTGTSMEKGGALTRMLEYILTTPVIERAFRIYLDKAAYAGAHQDDFFTALDESIAEMNMSRVLPAGVSVKAVMDPWTLLTGYPLVRVERRNNTLLFTQENIISTQPTHAWWVPIKVVSSANPVIDNHISDFWMAPSATSESYELANATDASWVLVNPDSAGFYRVLYDDGMYTQLKQQLENDHETFSRITRAQIMDDYMNFVIAKLVPLTEAVEVTNYITKEQNPNIVISAVRNMRAVIKAGVNESNIEEVKASLVSRMETILRRIGEVPSESNTPLENILRNELLLGLCENQSPLCQNVVDRYFSSAKTMKDVPLKKIVPADIQETVYCEIVKRRGEEGWELINQALTIEMDSKQSKALAKALGCANSAKLLELAISKIGDDDQWPEFMAYTNGDELKRIMLLSLIVNSAGISGEDVDLERSGLQGSVNLETLRQNL